MNKAVKSLLVSSLLAILLMPGLGNALNFDPADGLWIINQESNGEPGRGFQIEIQNGTIVLTFYGYDQAGGDAWWLASGSFAPNSNQVTIALGAYSGGMAFGDALQDATYLGPDGQVTISFNSNSSGAICLPGEPCKAISKLNFGYQLPAVPLSGNWTGSSTSVNGCQSTLNVNLTQTTTNITGSVTIKGNTLNCIYGTVPVTFPVYGIVDGESLVLGSVIQGSTAITFDGAILGGGNVLSGSFFDPGPPDFGTWSLQR